MPGYRREMSQRLGGLCGLGFVILYFAYLVMLDPPDISVPSSEVVDYWADSGNRAEAIVTATMCGTATLPLMGGALVAATTAGRKALGWRRWTAFVGWLSVVALLAPLAFAVLLILLLWTAVVSVWMLIFPRTAAQVTRA
jgi:hypothetical protein